MMFCPQCKNFKSTRFRTGVCNACYEYKRRNGTYERKNFPHGRIMGRFRCRNRNCRRPLNREGYDGKRHYRSGYCVACYSYRLRWGRIRPVGHVRQQAPHGWCQCGQPAAEIRTLTGAIAGAGYSGPQEWEEPLCERCAALEDE